MDASAFDYHLPRKFIAQRPLERRDSSRLLVLRPGGAVEHRRFGELPGLLEPGDLLVLNDTRVWKARFLGRRASTGGKVEALFLEELSGGLWLAWTRSGGKLKPGEKLILARGELEATLVERRGEEGDVLQVEPPDGVTSLSGSRGLVPIPPYISRPPERTDAERYQTIYARRRGAVAAPTAGLHFTEGVFQALEGRGVGRTFVTLHVGPGSFRPVKSETLEEHRVHSERFELGEEAARAINAARSVVAVGTTVARTLETCAESSRRVRPEAGKTDLFIYPPFEFRAVDVLLTNFHLPRSTLLALVSAFAGRREKDPLAGRDRILAAYEEAKELEYRFYSYGDAMLVF